MKNQRFIDMVAEKGIITPEDGRRLLAKFDGNAMEVMGYLGRGGAARSEDLYKLWGDSIGTAHVDLSKTLFQTGLTNSLPKEFAAKHHVIPIYRFGDAITLATADPREVNVLREAERILGAPVSPVFAPAEMIEDAIAIQYQTAGSLTEFISRVAENAMVKGTTQVAANQLRELAEDQSVVELVRGLMLLALRERASDIHIEPTEGWIRIRFRVDGVLRERMKLDKSLLQPLLSRLKIMAELDIIERRRPQDGRITLELANRSVDFRLSTTPTIYGEKVVLRILGQMQSHDVPDLEGLDLAKNNKITVDRVIGTPNGVFFVTGPTGSGKTTTLFSILKHLNTDEVNIMTVEDPVEYRLPGINQVQVNKEIGLDFARALRSFLRQDPNVILIGEIRDMETAKIASQAALTGHLVLATMHTNNALQAVTRLVEIGVEPFLVAPSIIGVMAQRLVRRVCPNCKEKYTLPPDLAERYFTGDPVRPVEAYRGKGCPDCQNSGYLGRIAIHEVFVMTENIRSMVAQGRSILDIQAEAFRAGFRTMRRDGVKKALRGLTTFEEIERVTVSEDQAPA